MIGVDRGSKRVQKEPKLKFVHFFSSRIAWCKCRSDLEISLMELSENFLHFPIVRMFPVVARQNGLRFGGFTVTTSKRMFTVLWDTIICGETKKRFERYSLQKNVRNSIICCEIFYLLWDLLIIVRLAVKHPLLILENSDLLHFPLQEIFFDEIRWHHYCLIYGEISC